ncbi:MAG: type II toxin-antitoxin system VapC family toxin [Desulfonatronovibrio sp.]
MIVLDTHVLLWMDRDDDALGKKSRSIIHEAWNKESVSINAISFWEAALLLQKGRIELPVSVEIWRRDLLQAGIREIPLDGGIALLATSLESEHRDPADRFIIATAIHHEALLVTADKIILGWKSSLKRFDART